jgi:adenosylhomocysteine nucleosidase
MSLVVVTGLAAEARIAVAGDAAIVGAGRAQRLSQDLEAAIAAGARRLLSFGIAGALIPHLLPGDLIVAHGVRDAERGFVCDSDWRSAIEQRLRRPLLRSDDVAVVEEKSSSSALLRFDRKGGWRPVADAIGGHPTVEIAGAEAPVADKIGKTALFAATGAVAVDMESAIVARAARRYGLPFAILRVVADPAHRILPSAALVAMRPDGEVDMAGVFSALSRDPRQITTLARLAVDARRAFAALACARAMLGSDFASLELEELRPNWRETAPARRSHSAVLAASIRGYAHDLA